MENHVKISILLDLYGKLLTQKQYNFLNDYYNLDLSLSEMAENYHITRQAVRDIIKKGEAKLFDLEESLKIMERNKQVEEKIACILAKIAKIQVGAKDEEIFQTLAAVKRELNSILV